jgi:hypothetical protein
MREDWEEEGSVAIVFVVRSRGVWKTLNVLSLLAVRK